MPAAPKTLTLPTEWDEAYTDADKAMVQEIINWLNKHNKEQAWLARLSRISKPMFHRIINGNYAPPSKHLVKVKNALEEYESRSGGRSGIFVETTLFVMASEACERAREQAMMTTIVGDVGTGKTEALKEYTRRRPQNTVHVHADPHMTPSAFMDELIAELGPLVGKHLTKKATSSQKFRAVVATLRHGEWLIIVDEADEVLQSTLKYARRLSDKAMCGMVFSGTPKLYRVLGSENGELGQISSRIVFQTRAVSQITRMDADAIVAAEFSEIDLPEEAHEMIVACCKGNARVLSRSLVASVRRYLVDRGKPVTAEAVKQIAWDTKELTPQAWWETNGKAGAKR